MTQNNADKTDIEGLITQIEAESMQAIEKIDILQFLDYTLLADRVTENEVTALCTTAKKEHMAAVCVYPDQLTHAHELLQDSPVKLATVVNFPHGDEDIDTVTESIHYALSMGADEIDIVMPYKQYIGGMTQFATEFIRQCKTAMTESAVMKVILESGAFESQTQLASACKDMIFAGADFLKTSTGKIEKGASLEAAVIILSAIYAAQAEGRDVGIKLSGGVRNLNQIHQYILLAYKIMGHKWVTPAHFRIGASRIPE